MSLASYSDKPTHRTTSAVAAPLVALVFGLIVLTLMRFGLVALVTSIFVTDLLPNFVFTTNFSAWYGSASLLVMLAVLGLAPKWRHA
jgi:hypothetical protein